MYPHERSLVQRLANKPFALIGVNSDKRERVEEALERENITWRSFWNGGSTAGPISKAWGVRAWPTIYVIDDRGVIRYKNVRGESMDQAVDELIERAVVTLVENIKSDDPEVRGLAAFRMGKYDAPDAVATITELLKDDEAVVRQRAATGLALRGEPVKPLLALIREATADTDAEVRVASLETLGAAKDGEATSLAMRAVEDEQVDVRRTAVKVLGQIGDPSAAPALAKAVDDDDMTTARNAAYALADLNAPESVELLKELVTKSDHPARVWVAVAMHRVEPSQTTDRFTGLMADNDVKIRRQAVSALAELKEYDPIDLYIGGLEDEDAQVSMASRGFLAKSDAPRRRSAQDVPVGPD